MAGLLKQESSIRSAESDTQEITWKRGIRGICPAGWWVEVGLRDGRLVEIRKDNSHALGMICRW